MYVLDYGTEPMEIDDNEMITDYEKTKEFCEKLNRSRIVSSRLIFLQSVKQEFATVTGRPHFHHIFSLYI
jgi:hypothetical protein